MPSIGPVFPSQSGSATRKKTADFLTFAATSDFDRPHPGLSISKSRRYTRKRKREWKQMGDELSDYDYRLPKELIAQEPAAHRADARLMVIQRDSEKIHHAHIRDLPDWLEPTDSLVMNDSRVIPARLIGRRERTGGRWQGLFLSQNDEGYWLLLGKTRGRLQPGEYVVVEDRKKQDFMRLQMVTKLEDGSWVAKPESDESVWDLLDRIGRIPLPHYIRGGEMVDQDIENYQTVFADEPGSVAAPTAGLHFTTGLLTKIGEKGIDIFHVTLHVGIGTFRPISVEKLSEHQMHNELGRIDASTAQKLAAQRDRHHRVIAVGTTSVRVLESCVRDGRISDWTGQTDLFIRPGFQFQAIDGLLTNFHLPKSTLLVLVRTFGGEKLMKRAYAEAVEEKYRFFSYGDAMLIL